MIVFWSYELLNAVLPFKPIKNPNICIKNAIVFVSRNRFRGLGMCSSTPYMSHMPCIGGSPVLYSPTPVFPPGPAWIPLLLPGIFIPQILCSPVPSSSQNNFAYPMFPSCIFHKSCYTCNVDIWLSLCITNAHAHTYTLRHRRQNVKISVCFCLYHLVALQIFLYFVRSQSKASSLRKKILWEHNISTQFR